MSALEGSFFFIYHPKYGSFSLIQVEESHEQLPAGFKALIPGSKDDLDEVLVQQDSNWLERLQSVEPKWFERIEEREVKEIEEIPYRMVVRYMSV